MMTSQPHVIREHCIPWGAWDTEFLVLKHSDHCIHHEITGTAHKPLMVNQLRLWFATWHYQLAFGIIHISTPYDDDPNRLMIL